MQWRDLRNMMVRVSKKKKSSMTISLRTYEEHSIRIMANTGEDKLISHVARDFRISYVKDIWYGWEETNRMRIYFNGREDN